MKKLCSIDGCDRIAERRGWCIKHYKRWYVHGDPNKILTAETGALLKWIEEHKDYSADECLMWPFGKISDGYCQVKLNGKWIRVNRLMCEHRHGPPPTPKHEAAHSCGKGKQGCVSPNHLDWKTNSENQRDRTAHGTSNRGQRQWLSKLTEEQVLEIRSSSETRNILASKYGVHYETIASIINRKNWAWLD